jgi:energy-converting hydrogenase Eha subunit A
MNKIKNFKFNILDILTTMVLSIAITKAVYDKNFFNNGFIIAILFAIVGLISNQIQKYLEANNGR